MKKLFYSLVKVVITTVSIFETVVQKCVEGRFWYKTTAIS